MPLQIRPARPADLDEAVAVWERSRRDAQPWLEERMGHTHEDNVRHFRDVVMRECSVWLAVDGAAVLGLLAVRGEDVDQLYVDPPRQGQRVGSALLDWAKQHSGGRLSLFTHQRNERARAFYEARGFRAVRYGVSPPPENEPDVEYEWRRSSG